MANMKLSLVLPMYNVHRYIERCLESIVSQVNDNVEIILIDDESPDDSSLIAKKICSSIPKLNWSLIKQNNKGLGGARNTGTKAAEGQYLWFIDSDDEIRPNVINSILNFISKGDDIIVCDFNRIDSRVEYNKKSYYEKELLSIQGASVIEHFLPTQVWRNIYKREFLLSNNIYFREKFLHEDTEFNMRAFTLAKSVSYYHICIYNYYATNIGSIMNSIKLKNVIDLFMYLDTTEELNKLYKLDNKQIKCICKYLKVGLNLLFSNATLISNNDFVKYKILLKNNRSRIYKSLIYESQYERTKYFVLSYFPFRWIYDVIYYKTIKKHK